MKYDMSICSCGRIHMIPEYKIKEALDKSKELLVICGGCGKAVKHGADVVPDFDNPNEDCYEMYIREEKNLDIKVMGNFAEIMVDDGLKVPMNTGSFANCYGGRKFSDMVYPDYYKIDRKDVTPEEVHKFFEKWTNDRTTVNIDRFVSMYENVDNGNMLRELSHYAIDGLDLKGTNYYDR